MKEKPVLAIMAAGIGSRYGGLKQMESITKTGHKLIDFSVYDALRAGFEKVIFIISRKIEDDFRSIVGDRIARRAQVDYVFQELSALPNGLLLPACRKKPWGTGHAVMCCQGVIRQPFALINADDYYGADAFSSLYDFLQNNKDEHHYAMVGFILENTMTENGAVARGVCQVKNGILTGIRERTHITSFQDGAKYSENGDTWVPLPNGATVSMNCWGFMPSIITELHTHFPAFFDKAKQMNLEKAEYFLPDVVGKLLNKGYTVSVLPTKSRWYGITYREDTEKVARAIMQLQKNGIYPENLWES